MTPLRRNDAGMCPLSGFAAGVLGACHRPVACCTELTGTGQSSTLRALTRRTRRLYSTLLVEYSLAASTFAGLCGGMRSPLARKRSSMSNVAAPYTSTSSSGLPCVKRSSFHGSKMMIRGFCEGNPRRNGMLPGTVHGRQWLQICNQCICSCGVSEASDEKCCSVP